MDEEYRVALIDLPSRVRALVSYDEDGYPTILINARLSRETQIDAWRHEVDHIRHEDMFSADDIRVIEGRDTA